ncbi:bifunctional UDP-N-acetylglucosamine diphosphorylase/glucosamine-1-phosphate N-acetyltransferase GlmU [Acidihalobacter prosperus]|uniref:Bifunctional protein GlmU n=1 Tax=Acidihalobacter prosperus TaxID=160660 RepID=A0A1A6C4T2_9GAMM|nr:bifunctional UDP-N-acetylglucosamine diphosphorylase/glucosamine-1-phosphate N-acetyltransferase GlmU [Acidihalobacter prosperus]OBS09555.1 UDP-N-acetylglucosamine diphosphorylase/glucosamine-1-phosphate N-acetyltransferase [Acidihalobacter prosperus]
MPVDVPVVPVILAAGRGTRMHSARPKVLQALAEKTLLAHVLDTVCGLELAPPVVVLGHAADQVEAALGGNYVTATQSPQLGTGHALQCALAAIDAAAVVLVLYGDVPLIRPQTLKALLASRPSDGLALLTVTLPDPSGYGRIVRDDSGAVVGIVEERDADESQKALREVNTGIMAAPCARWADWLSRVGCDNAQGEYYLTDCIALAKADGVPIATHRCHDIDETQGVNDRSQLAQAERVLRARRASALMRAGALLRNPDTIEIRGHVHVGSDVEIDNGAVFEGDVTLADGVRIGAHCVLRNCRLERGAEVLAQSVIDGAEVGAGCRIGPFARLRPGTRLAAGAHVGNFVEIKNAEIDSGSKINHLSYIGDASIGAGVNVGAGTITCNYDGVNKHRTRIGAHAFIGSNTALVAPVSVGPGATIGAGSVITRDAPDDKLTLARARQSTIEGWRRPAKHKE